MTERNPEQDTLDAIDELVNETMAAGLDRWGYPLDDYNNDRYPSCPGCDHDWHGIECQHCCCPSSEGEVLPPRPDLLDDPFANARHIRGPDFAASLNEVTGEVHHTCYPDPRGRCAWPDCDTIFRVPCACSCWGCLHVGDDHHCGGASRGCHRSRDLPFRVSGTDEDPIFDIPEPMRGAPWVVYHPETDEVELHNIPRGEQGYTIADVERMRWGAASQSWVRQDYPQRFVLGQRQPPRVRFWWRNELHNTWHMIEGLPEVMRIEWNRSGVSVVMRLDPIDRQVIADENLEPSMRPVSSELLPAGMIAMEGATIPEGFQPVGFLRPEDLDLEYNVDYEHISGGRDNIRVTQENYEATIRFSNEAAQAQSLRNVLPELEWWEI